MLTKKSWMVQRSSITKSVGWLLQKFRATSVSQFSNYLKLRIHYNFPTNPNSIDVFPHIFPSWPWWMAGCSFLFPFYGHCSNNISIFANSTNSWTAFPVFSQRIPISWLFYRFFPWKPMKISHQQIRFSLTFHKKVHKNHINHMKEPRISWVPGFPQKTPGRCRGFSGLYPSCRRRRKWATAGARSAGTGRERWDLYWVMKLLVIYWVI